jgi:hypothetical protein
MRSPCERQRKRERKSEREREDRKRVCHGAGEGERGA